MGNSKRTDPGVRDYRTGLLPQVRRGGVWSGMGVQSARVVSIYLPTV